MAVDVSAPMPQLDLDANAILTVTLDDPNALITQLIVHGWQDTGGTTGALSPVTGAYTEGDST